MLKKSGCTTLSYGIESGTNQMFKIMNKHSSVKNNYLALIGGRQHGIVTRGTMIGGMPEEKFLWAVDSIFFMANSGIGAEDLRMTLRTFIFPGTFWEKWFREKYNEFNWKKIPKKFRMGSFTDEFGNVVLPCYRWRDIPYITMYNLLKLYRSPNYRKILKIKRNILKIL